MRLCVCEERESLGLDRPNWILKCRDRQQIFLLIKVKENDVFNSILMFDIILALFSTNLNHFLMAMPKIEGVDWSLGVADFM